MKKTILVVSVLLSVLTPNAQAQQLDITTCNPELLKLLNTMTAPSKQQKEGVLKVYEILSFKRAALNSLATKISAKTEAAKKEADDIQKSTLFSSSKLAIASGKLGGHVEDLKLVSTEMQELKPCMTRAAEIIEAK